jgi:Transcriptional regulator, AbiEi antitoxin, Type IV TA system/Transcriptional regulator, AbiEi antitoxin N-terminal domain
MKSENSLENTLSEGLIVNRNWLNKKGFNRPLVDYYLRSGSLEAVARGVYRRPGPPLKWQHVVYSLRLLGYSVHVGGRSALALQGYSHYLPLGEDSMKVILLYGVPNLPGWTEKLDSPYQLILLKPRLFRQVPEEAIHTLAFGHWDWPIPHASVELALLEYLAEVNSASDFAMADKYFESATTLRPGLLQVLLGHCRHVRVKRLFLWFGRRHEYPWFRQLDISKLDLGSGKRMVVKDGALDGEFQITVPKEMAHGSEQSLF